MTTTAAYDAARVVSDLRQLDARTGGPEGSRRLAWTPEWLEARSLLREELRTLPVEVDTDAAGNLWAVLPGASDDMLVVGSHLDSVPEGRLARRRARRDGRARAAAFAGRRRRRRP